MRIVLDEYESNLWLPLCNIKLLLQKTNNSLNQNRPQPRPTFCPLFPPSSVAGRLNLDVMSLTRTERPDLCAARAAILSIGREEGEKMRYAIVTGASLSSIGFRAAQMLAGAPHRYHVILACRSQERGIEAKAAIEAADPEAKARFMQCDLADLESVRDFVTSFRAIDGGEPSRAGVSVLLCNAGVGFGTGKSERKFTAQQFEEKIGVNHLGHFLLTNLLLPDLQRSRAARVVVVASSLHDPKGAGGGRGLPATLGKLEDLHLAKEGAYDSAFAYKRSKLANLLFAYELKRRLGASGCHTVHVSSLCPGFIPATGLSREAGALGQFFLRWVLDGVLKWVGIVKFTKTVDQGAACCVLCATSVDAVDGGYHQLGDDGKLVAIDSSEESYDEALAKKLWAVSSRLTESHGSVADLQSLSPPRGGVKPHAGAESEPMI